MRSCTNHICSRALGFIYLSQGLSGTGPPQTAGTGVHFSRTIHSMPVAALPMDMNVWRCMASKDSATRCLRIPDGPLISDMRNPSFQVPLAHNSSLSDPCPDSKARLRMQIPGKSSGQGLNGSRMRPSANVLFRAFLASRLISNDRAPYQQRRSSLRRKHQKL